MKRNEKCEDCKQVRCIGRDGLCHECRVNAEDRDVIIIDGEEYVPGGRGRL